MTSNAKQIALRVILDILGLIPIVAAMAAIEHGKTYKRGYFKDDQSLMHPYLSNTVPSWTLWAINLPIIFFFIILFEVINGFRVGIKKRYLGIPRVVVIIYRYIYTLLVGFCITVLITTIGKQTVGRLRPHFFDVCDPEPLSTVMEYVTFYACKRTGNDYEQKDMIKSFPSGHSSVAMYNASFLVFYVYLRKPTRRAYVGLSMLLQVAAIAVGVFVCVSRISDYKHHWSDVLVGGVLGIIIAYITPKVINSVYYTLVGVDGSDLEDEPDYMFNRAPDRLERIKDRENQGNQVSQNERGTLF